MPELVELAPGAQVDLRAIVVRADDGQYTEVAFPLPDGETSHVVWLPSAVVYQLAE